MPNKKSKRGKKPQQHYLLGKPERPLDTKKQNIYRRVFRYQAEQLSSSVDSFITQYFKLGSLATTDLSAIQNLWDRYKVNSVKITWIPLITMSYLGSDATAGELWSILDFDDNATTSRLLMLDYPTLVCSQTTKRQSRTYVPSARITNNDGGMELLKDSWLDTVNPNTTFLGTKWMVGKQNGAPTTATVIGYWLFEADVSLAQGR
jgi:hypothetical protein